MNAILHWQGEAQWALIAQILKPCTSRLQLALIDELGSFSQIFESQESIENPVLNQQLKIVRRAYHSGRWQQKVEKIVQILKQYQTKIVPITSDDYPPPAKADTSAAATALYKGQSQLLADAANSYSG